MRLVLVYIALFISFNSIAQDFEFKIEPEKKGLSRYFPDKTLVKSNGDFFVISSKDWDEISIANYSSDLRLIKESKVKLTSKSDKNYYGTSFITPNDKVYLIVWSYDFKKKEKTYKKVEITEDCKLGEFDPEFNLKLPTSSKDKGDIVLHSSPNKLNNYLEYKIEPKEIGGFDGKFMVKVVPLKDNFNPEKVVNISIPGKTADFEYKSLSITNLGNVVFYHKINIEYKYGSGGGNFIKIFNKDGKLAKNFYLDKSDKYITDAIINFNDNNEILIYGLYSKKKNKDNINGICSYIIDEKDNSLYKGFSTNFDSKMLENFMSKKLADKKEEQGLDNTLMLRNLFLDETGNYIMVAEQEKLEVKGLNLSAAIFKDLYKNMGATNEILGSTKLYNLYYRNAVLINFNKDGEIIWSAGIRKNQFYTKDENNMVTSLDFKPKPNPSGIIAFDDKDKIHVVFNDSKKNQEFQEKDKKYFWENAREVDNYKDANCYVYSYDKLSGKLSKQMIFDGKKNKLYILPKNTKQIDQERYLVYAKRGNADAMGSLIVKNVDFSSYKSRNIAKQKISTNDDDTDLNQQRSNDKIESPNNDVKNLESSNNLKTSDNLSNSNNIDLSIPTNTSAIANGESNVKTETAPRIYEYKADEKSVDYYRDLRKKFELEEKIKNEKDAQLAKEKLKKEDEIKKSRHLSEDQAPQFDKYREGAKNPDVKKTTPEEDYKTLFQ